jgi:hypothetical protein
MISDRRVVGSGSRIWGEEDSHLEHFDLGTGLFETGLNLLSELADVTVAGGGGIEEGICRLEL